ncbi:MAG: histidine phosphatase family protein [Acidimicrobiales bacterium]
MSPLPQRCVLVRHGETEWSRAHRHTGRSDPPLLPEGETQAERMRPLLAGFDFDAVYASPLARARETALLAGMDRRDADRADGPELFDEPDLVEWDYGSYEGRTTAAIQRDRPGWNLFEHGAPGGETIAEVSERVDRVIGRIRAVDDDVACVAHAHVLRVLAARWIGLDPVWGRSLVLDTGSVSVLGHDHGSSAVLSWNLRPG